MEPGSANRLFDHWMAECKGQLKRGLKRSEFKRAARRIVEDFDTLPLQGEGTKPRVGVVGEILVKFHPTANNQVIDVIEREGCEAVVPGLVEFFLFGIAGSIFQKDPLGRSAKSALGGRIGLAFIDKFRAPVTKALRDSSRFEPPANIYELAEYASEILSLCNSMGEGWLLTAEMVELIKTGAPNVVCAQPFACLPNHVVGRAVISELRRCLSRKQHRCRGLRSGRVRGEPAQPHQTHDQRGESQPGREGAASARESRRVRGIDLPVRFVRASRCA